VQAEQVPYRSRDAMRWSPLIDTVGPLRRCGVTTWFRRSRLDLATAASVTLSVVVGVVGNYLVDRWRWGLFAGLVALVVSWVGLELVRHRLGPASTAPSTRSSDTGKPRRHRPPIGQSVAAETVHGRVTQVAGNQYNIGGGLGSALVLAAALLAAAVILAAGRATVKTAGSSGTTAAGPTAAAPNTPPTSPPSTPATGSGTSPRPYRTSVFSVGNSIDLDPPQQTAGLDDLSFNSKQGGLRTLNNATTAVAPTGTPVSAQTCSGIPASTFRTSMSVQDLTANTTLCVRTSDGRWASLAVTEASASALGGLLRGGVTVWSP
jgi:hypothetical protein